MRKLYSLLLAAAWLASFSTQARDSYTFSHRTEAYTELVSPTPLFVSSPYFDTIAAGFNMRIAGVTGDKLYLFLRGTMSTSGSLIDSTRFEPFSTEHGQGRYSYELSGAAGNHILKLQFKDLKFDHDMTGSDFMNFQVWLFERDGAIEVHFGSSSVTNPDWSYYYQKGGPAIGLRGAWLSGDPAAPVADTGTSRISGTPAEGTVYRFSLPSTGLQTAGAGPRLSVYPAPASGVLYVGGVAEGTEYAITDACGRLIESHRLRDGRIGIGTLAPGLYFLHAITTGGALQAAFVKQ